jgi:hypothetical protein
MSASDMGRADMAHPRTASFGGPDAGGARARDKGWPAGRLGPATRMGLEYALFLPDGERADSKTQLVVAAVSH